MGAPFRTARPPAQLTQRGLVGYWCMDMYDGAVRGGVPNLASGQAVSKNLYTAPRRFFSDSRFYINFGGCTVTDNAAADADGVSGEASTLVGAGGFYLNLVDGGVNLPAGTYTMAISARRNSGSDQSFAFTKDFTGTRSAAKVATSAWQRFSYSFTLGASTQWYNLGLCDDGAFVGANLQICDFAVYPGSSDLGALTNSLGGHFHPNVRSVDVLTVAGGFMDLTGKWGMAQLPASKTLTAFTGMAVIKKTSNANTVDAVFSKAQASAEFSLAYHINANAQMYTKATGQQIFGQYTGLWQPNGQGAHVVAWRVTATEESFWLDGVKLLAATATAASFSLRDLWIGQHDVYTGASSLNQAALWDNGLSDAEMAQNAKAMLLRAGRSNIRADRQRLYIAMGDSITRVDTYCYPWQVAATVSTPILGANIGQGGFVQADLVAQLPSVKAQIDAARAAGRQVVVSVLIGANDLATYPGGTNTIAANAYTTSLLNNIISPLRGYGAKVIACTILPMGTTGFGATATTHNARRAIANSTINGWPAAGLVDRVADFGADATYATDAAANDTGKYPDYLHPNAGPHGAFATLLVAQLNAIAAA